MDGRSPMVGGDPERRGVGPVHSAHPLRVWLHFWRAGAIAGVALALLLHVTAAVILVYGIYRVAERLISAPEGTSPDVNQNLKKAQVPVPGP